MKHRIALGALVALLVIVIAWWALAFAPLPAQRIDSSSRFASLPETLPETYPRLTEASPRLGLIDQRGELVEISDFEGRPVLVTFAFAHCRTICPMIVQTVKRAALEIGVAETGIEPVVVVVTLDPWRDTPGSLPSLVEAWGLGELPRAHVLSGEVAEVLAVLDAWNMAYSRDPESGDVSHPGMVYVVAPDGSLGYQFSSPTARWVADAVRRVTI